MYVVDIDAVSHNGTYVPVKPCPRAIELPNSNEPRTRLKVRRNGDRRLWLFARARFEQRGPEDLLAIRNMRRSLSTASGGLTL